MTGMLCVVMPRSLRCGGFKLCVEGRFQHPFGGTRPFVTGAGGDVALHGQWVAVLYERSRGPGSVCTLRPWARPRACWLNEPKWAPFFSGWCGVNVLARATGCVGARHSDPTSAGEVRVLCRRTVVPAAVRTRCVSCRCGELGSVTGLDTGIRVQDVRNVVRAGSYD